MQILYPQCHKQSRFSNELTIPGNREFSIEPTTFILHENSPETPTRLKRLAKFPFNFPIPCNNELYSLLKGKMRYP